ncbi:MAG: hypothetical protein H6Q65_2637 [Firmicutes bacterium]|nr:hypothetical protein [Bacillota bacterium]
MSEDRKVLSSPLLEEIRGLITTARSMAARNINLLQVRMNFEIGRRIVEEEQKGTARAAYGKQLLVELSAQLTAEFGRGFSRSNLEYMRKFYLVYQSRAEDISQSASGKFALSWSHYVFLTSLDNAAERKFYELEAAENSWTLPELRRQFDSGLYERLALSRDKEGVRELAQAGQVVAKPQDMFKNPYVLEFWGWMKRPAFPKPSWKAPSSANWNSFCWNSAKDSCLSRDKSALPLRKSISLWIWCFIIACCVAMY